MPSPRWAPGTFRCHIHSFCSTHKLPTLLFIQYFHLFERHFDKLFIFKISNTYDVVGNKMVFLAHLPSPMILNTLPQGQPSASPETVYVHIHTLQTGASQIVCVYFSHTNDSVLHTQFCTLLFPLNHMAWRLSTYRAALLFSLRGKIVSFS